MVHNIILPNKTTLADKTLGSIHMKTMKDTVINIHSSNGLSHQLVHMSGVVRKPAFSICENKDADQLRGNRKLISAFVFAIPIVQSLYYLNPKFKASIHLLWLYSPVCVGPGRKPRRLVFSQRGSYHLGTFHLCTS